MQQVKTGDVYAKPPVPGMRPVPRRSSQVRTTQPMNNVTCEYDQEEDNLQVVVTPKRRISLGAKLLFIGTVLALIAFWLFVTSVILPWFTDLRQQVTYGTYRINEQIVRLNGVNRDVITIGHKGSVTLIIMATGKLPLQEYVNPQFFSDGKSRVYTVRVQDVNHDGIPDLVLDTGNGSSEVTPVLYGKGDGGFTWAIVK